MFCSCSFVNAKGSSLRSYVVTYLLSILVGKEGTSPFICELLKLHSFMKVLFLRKVMNYDTVLVLVKSNVVYSV
jgi:hypothetical protein